MINQSFRKWMLNLLLTLGALLASSVFDATAADTELRRCVIDGKVVYRGGACPGQVDENARGVWNQRQIEREQKLEEDRRRDAMRQAGVERAERDVAESERRKRQARASAEDNGVVDCTNLYLFGKNARGDPDWVVRDTVKNAKAKGTCR